MKRVSAVAMKAFLVFLLVLAPFASAAGAEMLRVEFSNLAQVLPWSEAPGSLNYKGVMLCSDRENISSGERWFDVVVKLDSETAALEKTSLRVAVIGAYSEKPIKEVKQEVVSDRALVRVDLRQPGSQHVRVKAEWLSQKGQLLGKGEMWASGEDITPLAAGTRIPIKMDLPEGAGPLESYPVRFGLPLPEGAVWEKEGLKVVDSAGRELPSQLEVAGRWAEDGAAQWLWVDVFISGGAQEIYMEVGKRTSASAPSKAVKVNESKGNFVIDTGTAQYVVGADGALIKEARIGRNVIAKEGGARGLYVIDQKGRLAKASLQDAGIKLESSGPVSAVIRIEGLYRTAEGEALAAHITRLQFDAGRDEAKATHTLILTRDTNEVWFKDIGWEFEVLPGAGAQALFSFLHENPLEVKAVPVSGSTATSMLQKEGINLGLKPALEESPHTGWNMTPPKTAWTEYFYGTPLSVITEGGRTVHEGGEMGDWAALSGRSGGLMVSCRDAAAQHPKEFEVAAGRVNLKLYSSSAGKELDFRMEALMKNWGMIPKDNIEGGDKVPQEVLDNYLSFIKEESTNAVGWAKTHELLLMPFAKASGLGEKSLLHSRQVFAHIDPYWISKTEALGILHPKDTERFPAEEALMDGLYWYRAKYGRAEGGFIDYRSGPLEIIHAYGWRNAGYTLRSDSWFMYARSSERAIREFAQGANRAFTDNAISHWNAPDKIKGLLIYSIDLRGTVRDHTQKKHLPLYWEDEAKNYTLESAFNLNQALLDYYITGYRRAGDIVRNYAQAVKENLTVEERHTRVILALRQISHAYELTWEPRIRELIYEITMQKIYDPESEILLTKKDRYFSSPTYKTQTDGDTLVEMWKLLKDPLFHRMAMAVSRFNWEKAAILPPSYRGQNRCTGLQGHFLWEETGDPSIVAGFDYSRRRLTGTHLNASTGEVYPIRPSNIPRFLKGLPLAMDILTRADALEKVPASWIAFIVQEAPVSVFVTRPGEENIWQHPQKGGRYVSFENETALEVLVREEPDMMPYSLHREIVGSTVELKPRNTHLMRFDWSGQDLHKIIETSNTVSKVRIPKDAPGGIYEILIMNPGRYSVFADKPVPLTLYAPHGWLLPSMNPPVRIYFRVPEGAESAKISFSVGATLFMPDGTPFEGGKQLSGWVELPKDKPGLWSFESTYPGKIETENLPGFFALGEPEFYRECE